MKKIFEQPEFLVQKFAVEDQLLLSGIGLLDDETDIYGITGDAIVSRNP